MGHKTSQYFLFRDLVQSALNDGRIKFSKSKVPMKIVSDPLQVEEGRYVETMEINMVEITDDFDMEVEEEAVESSENQMKYGYAKTEEGMVGVLYRCKAKESEFMLFLRCSAVFDKKVAKEVENARQAQQKGKWKNKKP